MSNLKIQLTLLSCFFAAAVFAQPTSRGSFMIGTGGGYATTHSTIDVRSDAGNFSGDIGTSRQFSASPGIGYFFVRNMSLGIGMNYIASQNEARTDYLDPNATIQKSTNSDLLFGPFLRIFLPVSEDQAFFLGSLFGFGSSIDEFNNGTDVQHIDNRLLTWSVGPGFTIFAHNGIALETMFTYNYARSNSDIDLLGTRRTTRTVTEAFNLSIGMQVYFGGLRSAENPNRTMGQ